MPKRAFLMKEMLSAWLRNFRRIQVLEKAANEQTSCAQFISVLVKTIHAYVFCRKLQSNWKTFFKVASVVVITLSLHVCYYD